MGRLRVRRMPPNTFELLLNLTNRHIHAQLIDRHAGRVILATHTTEPVIRERITGSISSSSSYATGSVAAAKQVGQIFGKRATDHGVQLVYWQRPGRYHGKIKAFIDAVRECGIETKTTPKTDMPPPQIPEVALKFDEQGYPIIEDEEKH